MTVPLHGQIAVSGSAQQIDPSQIAGACTAFTLKAPLSNSKPVYIGSSTVTASNGFQLDPGDELTYERASQNGQPFYQIRPADLYVVGTSPDTVSWLASP